MAASTHTHTQQQQQHGCLSTRHMHPSPPGGSPTCSCISTQPALSRLLVIFTCCARPSACFSAHVK
jgi:hypothetical protein